MSFSQDRMLKADVVLPVRNGAKYIEQAICSLFHDSEFIEKLIIIDDGSTDSTPEILGAFRFPVPTKIIRQEHRGLVTALNRGISEGQSRFIARIDADDIWLKGKLPEQIKFLTAQPEIAVVGTQAFHIDESGRSLNYDTSYSTLPRDIRTDLLKKGRSVFAHSSVVMRRDIIEKVGGYRTAFECAEDFDLWLRLAEKYQLANLSNTYLYYRRHRESVSERDSLQQLYSRDFALFCSRSRRLTGEDPLDSQYAESYEHFREAGGIDISELKLAHKTAQLLENNKLGLPSREGLQALIQATSSGYLGQERKRRYRLLKAAAKAFFYSGHQVAALKAYSCFVARRIRDSKFFNGNELWFHRR